MRRCREDHLVQFTSRDCFEHSSVEERSSKRQYRRKELSRIADEGLINLRNEFALFEQQDI